MPSSLGAKFVNTLSNTDPQMGSDGVTGVAVGTIVFVGVKVGARVGVLVNVEVGAKVNVLV